MDAERLEEIENEYTHPSRANWLHPVDLILELCSEIRRLEAEVAEARSCQEMPPCSRT